MANNLNREATNILRQITAQKETRLQAVALGELFALNFIGNSKVRLGKLRRLFSRMNYGSPRIISTLPSECQAFFKTISKSDLNKFALGVWRGVVNKVNEANFYKVALMYEAGW